jgi:translocation and assembly module TamB
MLVIIAFAFLGYTRFGNQFLADQIASRASNPDMRLKIDGARGLLAGNFRVDRITVADTKGTFAEVENVAIDWSPWSLLTAEFDADRIAATSIKLARAPIQTIPSEPSTGSSFSLPVEIDVRKLDLPSVSLGEDLLGRSAELALSGAAKEGCDRRARGR